MQQFDGEAVRCAVSIGPLHGPARELLGAIMVMSAEQR